MNEIRIFNNEQFGQVRTIQKNGETWFVAADVCRALEHSNVTVALDRLDEDEKAKLNLGLRGGDTGCVNESGLYSLVLGSRKPEAKVFKRWITHDVIPAIRKTGGYIAGEEHMSDEELLNRAVIIAHNKINQQNVRIAYLEEENKEMLPKAVFADVVSASKTSILVGELAKLLKQNGVDIGQKRLFERLRKAGYLIKGNRSDCNMPTQKSMDLGLFEIKETCVTHSDGHTTVNKTVKVTGKGQVYFINLFLKKREKHVS